MSGFEGGDGVFEGVTFCMEQDEEVVHQVGCFFKEQFIPAIYSLKDELNRFLTNLL